MHFRSRQILFAWLSLLLSFTGFVKLEMLPHPVLADGFADTAFNSVWERTDKVVASNNVARTWLWGPDPGRSLYEEYGGSGSQRLVQYFDKSRMEITNPSGDRSSEWYVTNGLLAKELISGNMQLGDNSFVKRGPAGIPVAGDQDDPNGPTYADLAAVSTLAPDQNTVVSAVGGFIDTTLLRGKKPGSTNLGDAYGVRYGSYVSQSGHNIAGPFWDYLNSTGPVFEGGKVTNGKLFDPIFFATGLPLSEAYWVRAKVGGVEKDVLIQAFERRVLTFTPSNEPQWRVEMGNIGQHYYHWRYENKPTLAYDTRFGMAVTGNTSTATSFKGDTVESYINTLGGPASWYDYTNVKVSAEIAKNRAQLVYIRQNWTFAPGTYERKRLDDQLSAAPPGGYWLMGTEVNVDGIEQTTPARYAQEYETAKNLIHAKDPTAKMVGPNILNWNYTCNGCPGYQQADGWTKQMMQEYRQLYGHEIDFDVWGIHTYGLNWNKLPMTDYQQDISQVTAFREFLKTQPAQANKPIWITEFGVIWGYDRLNWQQDSTGKWIALPAGTYQKQALVDYLTRYTEWLVTEGPKYNVEKWFLYGSAGIPEAYTTTFSGINLFDGLTPGSKLTDFGQLYRARAMQASSSSLSAPTK